MYIGEADTLAVVQWSRESLPFKFIKDTSSNAFVSELRKWPYSSYWRHPTAKSPEPTKCHLKCLLWPLPEGWICKTLSIVIH